jgi:hypothetical protein
MTFKEKLFKLFNNLWFIISVVTLILTIVDNIDEIKACIKKLLERESYIKFKNDVSDIFSTYGNKMVKIQKQAVKILEE